MSSMADSYMGYAHLSHPAYKESVRMNTNATLRLVRTGKSDFTLGRTH